MDCPKCKNPMTNRVTNEYCKACGVAVILNNEGYPANMSMQMHLGTFVFPICYDPDVPGHILLATSKNRIYTYKLVE